MHPYSYAISLRIWHPSKDPALITQALGLKPEREWQAGKPRSTPKGTPLQGCWPETYWCASLLPDREHSSDGTLLEEYLSHIVSRLQPSREFFESLRVEGARAELFLGLYGDRNFGFELTPGLLSDIGGLGLALSFDVYPE